jgi:hypothetical protein
LIWGVSVEWQQDRCTTADAGDAAEYGSNLTNPIEANASNWYTEASSSRTQHSCDHEIASCVTCAIAAAEAFEGWKCIHWGSSLLASRIAIIAAVAWWEWCKLYLLPRHHGHQLADNKKCMIEFVIENIVRTGKGDVAFFGERRVDLKFFILLAWQKRVSHQIHMWANSNRH